MTKAQIETKKKAILRKSTMQQLLQMWEISEIIEMTESVAMVRGWIMDELKRRDPEAYDRWMDSEDLDAQPGDFFHAE